MHGSFTRRLLIGLIACISLIVQAAHSAAPVPFSVSYEVIFRGLNAGTASLTLERENGERWRYESRNEARGLFRLAFPGEITQTSVLRIDQQRVIPLQYRADDGTDSIDKDIELNFDQAAGRVSGIVEGSNVSLSIEPGVQDPMSVQIAVIQALSLGQSPTRYALVDKREIKTYEYRDWGRDRITTPLGPIDTVIWSSARVGSDRVTKVWYAPSLGYVPVRAERRRGDKLEWAMNLKTLKSSAK
jgi:hypothetical protein